VHLLQELCQVKAVAALLMAHTKKDLNYEAYSTLLLSGATHYFNYMINKGKRLVYARDVMDHDDDDFNEAPYEVASFNIDTPVDIFASKW
jgi:hypothetical protein